MINATIFRDSKRRIKGFTVKNHGESFVCAAVSMLVLNTVNSIEFFTKDEFVCNLNEEDGGFLDFSLANPATITEGTRILLEAMVLGLMSAQEEYPDEIKLKES